MVSTKYIMLWNLGTILSFVVTRVSSTGSTCSVDGVTVTLERNKNCTLQCKNNPFAGLPCYVQWFKVDGNGDDCSQSQTNQRSLVTWTGTDVEVIEDGYDMDRKGFSLIIEQGKVEGSGVFTCTVSRADSASSSYYYVVKTKLDMLLDDGSSTVQTTAEEAVYTSEDPQTQSGVRITQKPDNTLKILEEDIFVVSLAFLILLLLIFFATYILYVLRRRGKIRGPEKPVGGPSEQKFLSYEEKEGGIDSHV